MENMSEVQMIVMRERRLAVSDREWHHRLRGYGYGIRDTQEGRVVTSILHDRQICPLPAHIIA